MRLGLGIGISMFRRHGTGGPFEPITYPINPALWSASEAVADANTRKVQTIANIPAQDGYEIGEHHSTNPAGNIAQIGLMTWDGSKYTRTSTNPVTRGSNQYNRLARRLVGLGWEWITGPADTKPFTASDVPDAPTGSWAALSSGVVRVTLAPWNGQRRAVTGGEYQIGSGSWVAFTAAASGSNTIVDVPGLTDGVETGVNFRWVNANVDSTHPAGVLSMTVIAQSVAPVPVAPRITYLVDGSGTQATVYFDLEGGTPTDVTGIRYRIGGGSSVVRAGVAPLALTGLAASQSFEAEWTNSTGYSATTAITLLAALPTYQPSDWTATNASTEAGDGVNLTYSNHPSAPTGMVRLGTQWSADAGVTWQDFTTSPVATGIPNAANSILSRAIFDVGPSIASAAKAVTPTYPALVTDFPLLTGPVVTNTGNANVNSIAVNLPTHDVGQRLVVGIHFDGNPTPSASGWPAPTRISSAATDGNLWLFDKIAASASETLTITLASAVVEQAVAHAFAVDGARSMIVSTVDETTAATTAPNIVDTSFGGAVEKAFILMLHGQLGSPAAPSAAPGDGGWSALQTNVSAATSAGVRLTSTYKQIEATTYDPAAWPDAVANRTVVMLAFLPVTSVPPVTSLSVAVSATEVAQGDPITFTMTANGRRPVTYQLVIDGSTYTNTTGIFTVTPSAGIKAWTASATNAAGSAPASGSVTVQQNMVFTIDAGTIYTATFEADTVPHTVTPATYELEWGLVSGSATLLSQPVASPDFTITFPENGAYRIRARARNSGGVAGSWSDYLYYAPMVVGEISWPIQNLQAVQISPLMAQGPVEGVPVTGRQARLHEPRPAVARELWGSYNHYLHGVAINPSAKGGRGPQFWDSRQGGQNAITTPGAGYFDAADIATGWPRALSLNDTVSKVKSRPTASLNTGSQGYRSGLIDQHGGLVIVPALSTISPMQAAPAIIKHGAWAPGVVDLPGWSSLLSSVLGFNLSTSGMSVYPTDEVRIKMSRFDPVHKLMRGGTYWNDSQDAHTPFGSKPSSAANHYYKFQMDANVACLLLSNAVDNDWKTTMLGAYVLRGLNIDFPGNSAKFGAGINQALLLPLALSRIARGMSIADLATTQRENIPTMFGFWDSTTVTYLGPHDSATLPLFSKRRQITDVLADVSGGHRFMATWGASGEIKQRFEKLHLVREATGERLPVSSAYDSDTNQSNASRGFGTIGLFSTPLTVGEWVYMEVPASAAGGFAIGEPYWMYSNLDANPDVAEWRTFNPSPEMSYRDINEPQGKILLLSALGVWPSTAGSSWDACKKYTLKSRQVGWPGTSLDYGFTATNFVTQFWDAHAATLGITL